MKSCVFAWFNDLSLMFEQNRIKIISPFYKVVKESLCAIIYFTVCVQSASIFHTWLRFSFHAMNYELFL